MAEVEYGHFEFARSENSDALKRPNLFEMLPGALTKYILELATYAKNRYYFGYASDLIKLLDPKPWYDKNDGKIQLINFYGVEDVLDTRPPGESARYSKDLEEMSGFVRETCGINMDFPALFMNERWARELLRSYKRGADDRILAFFARFSPALLGNNPYLYLFDNLFLHSLCQRHGRAAFVSLYEPNSKGEDPFSIVCMQWKKMPKGVPANPYLQVGRLDEGEGRFHSTHLELVV